MSRHDLEYLHLLERVLEHGEQRTDRTGVGTRTIFGTRMQFDLADGFPLLTTKKVYWKGIVEELLWFLRGETNIKSLQAAGVNIWDEWADARGELGPVYGKQWRNWPTAEYDFKRPEGKVFHGIDQIEQVWESIVENPDSRRHIVTAWNPAEVDQMMLPPCHCLFQFDVTADDRLNLQLYQRSADMFLGVPFNIASYSLLMIMAQCSGYEPGVFTWVGGNTHIYLNHLDQAREQLSRPTNLVAPTVKINPSATSPFHFGSEDIMLFDYHPMPAIKAEVAV